MSWFKTTDTLMTDAKVMMMPLNERGMALGTWISCGTWSTQHLTDGKVPAPIVEAFVGTLSGAETLVAARMWKRVRGGFQFNNWAKYQFSREQIETKRDEEKTRKAEWRDRNKKKPLVDEEYVPDLSQWDTDGTNVVSNTPVPTRPDPSHKEDGKSSGGKSPKQETSKHPPQPCGRSHDTATPCGACGLARKSAKDDDTAAAKARSQAKSAAAKAHTNERHRQIAACDDCDEKGYTSGGKACHHQYTTPAPSTLRDSMKSKPAKEEA